MRLSRYATTSPISENVSAVVNAITGDIVFGKRQEIDSLLGHNSVEKLDQSAISLLRANHIIGSEQDDDVLMGDLGKKIQAYAPALSLLRVMFTDLCNLRCEYCKVLSNTAHVEHKVPPQDRLEYALKLLTESKHNGPKIVHITGGEPLIFPRQLLAFLAKIEEVDRDHQIMVVIGTNAVLLREDLLREIANTRSNVKFIVSMDGQEHVHDALRHDRKGGGSFKKVRKGISLLKDRDFEIGISMVVGGHNVEDLDQHVEFLVKEFSPSSLGVNLMKPPSPDASDFKYLISPHSYVDHIYELFRKYREQGVYMELVCRKVLPVAKKSFRLFDCGASSGTTLNIDTKGHIGPCKSFLVNERESHTQLVQLQRRMPKQWHARTPINRAECSQCSGLSTCGNGCAYDAMITSGDATGIDQRHCEYTRLFFRQVLVDLFNQIPPTSLESGFRAPTPEERLALLGKAQPVPYSLKWSIGHATSF